MLYRIKLLTMHFTKLSFEEYMFKVAELIGNSLSDSSILEATGRFGYDEKRIKEGEKIYRDVQDVNSAQNRAMENKILVHDERKRLQTSLRKKYMKMLQISRIAFDKDVIIRKALQLEGPREVSLEPWLNQVALFGTRLLSENNWSSKLREYGISNKDLISLKSDVEKLRTVALSCEQAKEESKKQTSLKKRRLKELQEWVSDYLKIAKIALEDKPDLFLKLRA